jgi:hypothetical protein
MKQNIYLLILIFGMILPKNSLANFIQKENIKAYITISFENPVMFKDSTSKNIIKSKIENIFENEGIFVIHDEKPEEYKLDIDIIIKDSLIMKAKGIGVGGGNSIITVLYPQLSYPYKNVSEIYYSIKDYIKNVYKKNKPDK